MRKRLLIVLCVAAGIMATDVVLAYIALENLCDYTPTQCGHMFKKGYR